VHHVTGTAEDVLFVRHSLALSLVLHRRLAVVFVLLLVVVVLIVVVVSVVVVVVVVVVLVAHPLLLDKGEVTYGLVQVLLVNGEQGQILRQIRTKPKIMSRCYFSQALKFDFAVFTCSRRLTFCARGSKKIESEYTSIMDE
jgi:hypothetical protein